MIANVFQEGRFVKAITLDGQDVSNQIERNIRKEAIAANCQVIYDSITGSWMLHSGSNAMPINLEIDTTSDDPNDSHESVKRFIHRSIAMKPSQLLISDLKWKYLVRSVMRGKNIMMVGPAGSGKTLAAKYLVQTLERPDFYFNLGSTQDPRATLIGNTHFSKDTGTYFAESMFVKAIQTENAVILLDELSRAHPEAWNILMTVLDLNQRYLRLDEKDGAPTIKVAPGVSFIATANIGNEYTSTRVLDRALMDRFITIEMDQLSGSQEFHLLKMKFPAADTAILKSIAEIADLIRTDANSENPKLSNSLSTRATVELASLVYDGFTLSEAAEVAIYPFFSADGGVESERTFIKQIVQKYCGTSENAPETPFNVSDTAAAF